MPRATDVCYHGSALDKRTGEVLDFQCRATLKGLVQQLKQIQEYFGGSQLKLCYKASYVGFSLQRGLTDRGFDSEVVDPSSVPRRACRFAFSLDPLERKICIKQ